MPLSEYLRRLRQKVGHDLLLTIGVSALIGDDAGRFLLQKRGDTHLWSVPGGSIDPHESPADAVVREVWEETGLLVEPRRVLAVYGGPEMRVTYPNGDQTSNVIIVFECQAVGGDLHADGNEALELAYCSPEEALQRLPLEPRLRSRFAQVMDSLHRRNSAYFDPPAWQPPPDGIRANGMSDYMRSLREQVGADLLMVAGAVGIIFDGAGRVLMQKRGDTGGWGNIGGAMDPDEAPADAVVREVWEETGLLVEPVRITGVYGGPEYYVVYPHGDQISVVSIVFACRAVGGDLRADGVESLDLAYFPPADVLANPDIPRRMRTRVQHAVEQHTGERPPSTCFASPSWQPPGCT